MNRNMIIKNKNYDKTKLKDKFRKIIIFVIININNFLDQKNKYSLQTIIF